MVRSSTFLVGAALVASFIGLLPTAQAQESAVALEIVATAVRTQGFPCEKPSSAQRDAQLSKPNLPVWLLTCESVRYRVEIVTAGRRARVTKIE
jgi:hypothetical protein